MKDEVVIMYQQKLQQVCGNILKLYIHTHTHTHIHTYVHTYIHTYLRTHI